MLNSLYEVTVVFSVKLITYFEKAVFSISCRISVTCSWYYVNTCRNESEAIVEHDGREGCFMVRDSSKPGVFTLTLLVKSSGLVTASVTLHILQLLTI